jgi:uncharacterized repeat protein (TIGR01451 family)
LFSGGFAQMLMRRVIILFASVLLLTGTIFAGVALADDDTVSVSNIRVSPDSLAGDGQVSITVNVAVDSSRADGGIANVYIAGAGVASTPIDGISIGANSDIQCTMNVTAAQLGKDIPLKVKWDGGENSFTVKIESSVATEPKIVFSRTIDKTSVGKGDSITLIYNLDNTGSVDISNIVITDDGLGSAMSLTKSALKAGSSTALTYSYTVISDFTSVPRLSYKVGDKTYSASLGAKTVSLKNTQLDAVLEASPDTAKSGDEITLLCTLTNSGNVKLTNIVISEATLGSKLFTSASLDKDTSKQFSKRVTLTQTTKFQYVITAKDDTGHSMTFKSNVLEVKVSSASDQYDLEIMASADALQLSEPGSVNFDIIVTNKGSSAVANAKILDQDGKEIKSFATLPLGPTEFTYPTTIDKTTQFNFSLVVPGTNGDYQVYTGPMEIKLADAATASPAVTIQATPEPSPTGTEPSQSAAGNLATPNKLGALLTALFVVGALIAITIVVLIVMVTADKRKQKKQR